jgi:adenine deaminase
MKMLKSYVENGITINVYPEKVVKRNVWIKNGSFYASKMRIEEPGTMFTPMTRKAGKA